MSLGQLPAAAIVTLTDKLVAGYEAAAGTSGSGLGLGDGTFGLSKKMNDFANLVSGDGSSIYGLGDSALQAILDPLVQTFTADSSSSLGTIATLSRDFSSLFAGLDRAARNSAPLSATITSFDTLMSWLNYGNGSSYWQCLAHMDWAKFYYAVKGIYPSGLNVYFDCRQGGSYAGTTFTNALGKLVVGTGFTAGYIIPNASHTPAAIGYAGGLAYANVTAITGSGLLTVNGLDQNGNAETWTATISAIANVLLTPSTHAYSCITQVTGMSATAGVTAGTISIEAHAPAGRSVPPT